jgi:hypothetical protein
MSTSIVGVLHVRMPVLLQRGCPRKPLGNLQGIALFNRVAAPDVEEAGVVGGRCSVRERNEERRSEPEVPLPAVARVAVDPGARRWPADPQVKAVQARAVVDLVQVGLGQFGEPLGLLCNQP